MKAIYKYPLKVEEYQTVELPIGAKVLSLQTQGEVPCLWALVNPDRPTRTHTFRTLGTGADFSDSGQYDYVGTYQLGGEPYVFHVFEKKVG